MITVNAKLFRVASMFAGKNQVRTYLNGVRIEKAKEGVILVATDGHRMIVINDREGKIEGEPLTLKVTKHFIDATKKTKDERKERKILATSDGAVSVLDGEDDKVIVQYNDFVTDNTLPVWRKAFNWDIKEQSPAGYNYRYLNDFGKAGNELTGWGNISIKGTEDGPAIIGFYGCDYAFGVLMPVKFDRHNMNIPENLQYLKNYK